MRSSPWTALLFCTAALLVSCGGGGSTSNPSARTNATCDSQSMWAVPSSSSGSLIPDNASTGISATWDNQNCSLQTVASASVDICLNHSQPADLAWTITTPATGNALTLSAPSNWNTSGTACDDAQGKLQRIALPAAVQSISSTRGLWTLHVSDQSAGNTGTLIQWRVIIEGYN